MGANVSVPQQPDPASLLGQFATENTGSLSAMQWASKHGHRDLVRHLLEVGVDIDYRTTGEPWEPSQDTPLQHAVSSRNDEIVELLLQQGARIDIAGSLGNVLHQAVRSHGFTPCCSEAEVVERYRADVAVDRIISMLLARGPDLSLRDPFGGTALHCADNKATMELLLDHGANVNDLDNDGNSVLHYASERGKEADVRLLLERGANPKLNSWALGLTPLHVAAENASLGIAQTLLEFGADANAENKGGLALADYIRTVAWAGNRASYRRMVLLLLRASGLPEMDCRSISDERCQGDKEAHDKIGKAQWEMFLAELGLDSGSFN